MNQKNTSLKGNVKVINRFNKDPKTTVFFNEFQEIMIQRLSLNYMDMYHKDNIEKIIRFTLNKPANTINTKIRNGLLLSCNIEPELYIKIQETVKKLTGNYTAMDELIHFLLTYFCYIYSKGYAPKKELPYKQINKGKRFQKLLTFQKRFKKYYPNTVRNFLE